MSLKPILFSTPMVQAILDGHKTKTRRVITVPKWALGGYDNFEIAGDGFLETVCENTGCLSRVLPKYNVGDILWVRETWCQVWNGLTGKSSYEYKANGSPDAVYWGDYRHGGPANYRWIPSIFMPREACRIFLRVTEVRAERLQDITRKDILREGVQLPCARCSVIERFGECGISTTGSCKEKFPSLWDSINDKRGFGWDTNPWVWVISFERCEKPEGV